MSTRIFIISKDGKLGSKAIEFLEHDREYSYYIHPFNSINFHDAPTDGDDSYRIKKFLQDVNKFCVADIDIIEMDSTQFYDHFKSSPTLSNDIFDCSKDHVIELTSIEDHVSRPYIQNRVTVELYTDTLLELRSKLEMAIYIIVKTSSRNNPMINNLIMFFEHTASLESCIWNNNYYHNKNHTRSVLTDYLMLREDDEYDINDLLAIIFHDVKYCSRNTKHENIVNAIKYLTSQGDRLSSVFSEYDNFSMDRIKEIIIDADNMVANALLISDLSHFNRTAEEIIEIEKLIMKEYYHVDFFEYKKEHIRILKEVKASYPGYGTGEKRIEIAINWLESYEPKIAWFCGSFNPFHVGHYDILKKAEKMFDRVVIVQLNNPAKNSNSAIKPINALKFPNESLFSIDSNVPELINHFKHKYIPTLIRGIRNSTDMHESIEWINQINEFFPEHEKIQLCMIPADNAYSHISSSFIKQIADKKIYNKLII